NPRDLQVVDESIALRDLLDFADRIGANVMQYNHARIYRSGVYVHAMLERLPKCERLATVPLSIVTAGRKLRKKIRTAIRRAEVRRKLKTFKLKLNEDYSRRV